MSRFLTTLCVIRATIFVDHCSEYVYVFLMRDLILEEILFAKELYEQFLATTGVKVKSFHTDNGRYAD